MSERPIQASSGGAPLVARMLRPLERFLALESASGVVLLACGVLALAWANSPWSASYFALWHHELRGSLGDREIVTSVGHVINDALMAIFFFLVGLEIKREVLVGELASRRHAALPVVGAAGGMLVPALIYVALNAGTPGIRGWGIPVATDIAFAVGVIVLLGPRVPVALKVFLTALAIADDIGAVIVIALFYTEGLNVSALLLAALVYAVLIACNRAGIRRGAVYLALGVVLWALFVISGVHATVAGVLLAFAIPSLVALDDREFLRRSRGAIDEFERAGHPDPDIRRNPARQSAVRTLRAAAVEVQSPLIAMEHALHGWVAFGIMPLFALANAGVALGDAFESIHWRITLGIFFGLLLGKPVGITLAAWLAARARIAALPAGSTWRALHGISWLGGIGFTMSLFIATLAFEASDPTMLSSAKLGILSASLAAGIVGGAIVRFSGRADS